MKSSRLPAILLTFALLCVIALGPQAALADTDPKFVGSWYAISFVLNGTEWYPETWDRDLVVTLSSDGRFSWGGKFYNNFTGTWSVLKGTELQLLVDNEDGTPGSEEDAVRLTRNQDGCLVYVEENGPTIIFADHIPNRAVRPEVIRGENVYQFSGSWVLTHIFVADMFVTTEQFTAIDGTEISSSLVLDGLDAYLAFRAGASVDFSQQFKMKYDNGTLVQAQTGGGNYLRKLSLTDNGMLLVEFSPDGSEQEPLMFYFEKAE